MSSPVVPRSESAAAGSATNHEPHRPQFHVTPARGWLNDPVGMCFYAGEFHLHYLGQPEKPEGWGDAWMHLVSQDMLHWQELAPSVPGAGGSIGGGSVVVDANNTSGLRSGEESPLVLFWNTMTSIPGDGFVGGPARAEQRVHTAHSTDRGRTWTPYAANPILAPTDGNADFRDPSVMWHETSQRWIMLVCRGYHELCDVFASPDLRSWQRVGNAPNGEEPRLLQLPVRGTSERRWVFLGGDYPMSPPHAGAKYIVGDFDGMSFTAATGARRLGGNHFVGHSFDNMPDGRQIWIGWKWLRDEIAPGPWTGGPLTIPVELSLDRDPENHLVLHYNPVQELQALRREHVRLRDRTIGEASTLLTDAGIKGELFEIIADFEIGSAREFGLEFRKGAAGGFTIGYDARGRRLILRDPKGTELLSQLLYARRGRVKLHLLLDRSMLDVFGNDGITWNCAFFRADPAHQDMELYAKGGEVRLHSFDLWPLKSVW